MHSIFRVPVGHKEGKRCEIETHVVFVPSLGLTDGAEGIVNRDQSHGERKDQNPPDVQYVIEHHEYRTSHGTAESRSPSLGGRLALAKLVPKRSPTMSRGQGPHNGHQKCDQTHHDPENQ